MGTCDDFKFLLAFNPFVPGSITSCRMWLGFAMSVELAHHWARNLVPTLLLIAPSLSPWISISLLCVFCTLKKLSLHRRHSKPLKSYFASYIVPGHERTAGQRTMSRLIGELTGQPFVLPTGRVHRSHLIVLEMNLIKISMLFSCFSCYQDMYVVSPCVLCETLI